jgi:hypothetical protein
MTEQSNNRCIVLLPAADPRFTRLFDELFNAAITEAGLVPHRIEQTAAEHPPVDRLIREIAKADVVFADLSESSDEIWLALGCALALNKQLCLISSTLEFSLPLNLQGLDILPYPAAPFPRDYTELRLGITHQLLTKRPKPVAPPAPQQPVAPPAPQPELLESLRSSRPQPLQQPLPQQPPRPQPVPPPQSLSQQQPPQPPPQALTPPAAAPIPATAPIPVAALPPVAAAPPADAFANTPLFDELTSHEVLALTIIDIHASSEGLSPRDLGREMQANDSAHLTSHAMSSLKRRKFIDRRPVSVTDGGESYLSDNLFITWSGKNWLLRHGKRDHSLRSNSTANEIFMAAR